MSVSVRTFLAGSVLEVSVFLLIEMEEIGLAPEVPEEPAPGSDPKEPVRTHHEKTSVMMIKYVDNLLVPYC